MYTQPVMNHITPQLPPTQSNADQLDQPMALQPAGSAYTAAHDHHDSMMLEAPDYLFPGRPADGPTHGLPMSCDYSTNQHAESYLVSYNPATSAGQSTSFVNWTLFTNPNPSQIHAPIFPPGNAGATNTFGSNVQGNMASTFLQLPPPPTSIQDPFFPPLSSSYTTDNAMGPTSSIGGFAAPNIVQELPSGSRPTHVLDPDVYEGYQCLHLQTSLKDPKDQQFITPVDVRREKKVVLGLVLDSDSQPIDRFGWEGIQLPQTRSVRSGQQQLSEKLLNLSIQLFGGSTGAPNPDPCRNCWAREREAINPKYCPENVPPYMIDFKSKSLTTALSRPLEGNCLEADVMFHFTCYSKHHEGTYKLIVKLHDESGHLVAQSLLPYEFIVKANSNGTGNRRTRASRSSRQQILQPGSNPSLASSHINTRANPPSSTPSHHPLEAQIGSAPSREGAEGSQEGTGETETEGASLGNVNERPPTAVSRSQFPPEPPGSLGQASSTSPNRPLAGVTAATDSTSSGTSAAAETSLSSVSDRRGQQQALSVCDGRRRPLETSPAEGEANPTVLATEVEEVSPDKGPTTGGVRIIILGYNFPSVRLYARFGDIITCTTRRSEDILRCILPPTSRPCKVKVTLSQAPSHDSPEFGRSFAHFEYEDSRALTLSSLLKMVLETLDGRSLETIFTSIQQRLESAFGSSTGANVHTTQEHGGSRTAHLDFQVEELEDVSIRFLSAHSKTTNWKQIVSLQNNFGQTMAHIAVMLGYPRLLGSLIGWEIDLNLTDLNGSTALHYAFLCNESACAVLLIRSGADELALDELGRSAWDLNPSLADECTSRLRGVPKVDGSFSVSCRPAEESEMERAEEAAALEATYLLVQRWLELMEEEGRDTNDLNGEHMPQFGISPPCLPSNLRDRNDLTVERTRIEATRPNQSAGMVPKVHPISDNLHLDPQPINSLSPHYSEWDGNKPAQSPRSTINAINLFVVQPPQPQDMNGSTALHCAHLCGDSDSVQALKGYGADEDIEVTLGRRPLDMYTQSTNDLGKSSSSSVHTSGLAQLSSAWEEQWVKVSVAPSQPGSCSEVETTTDPLDSRHEPPHACEPSTSVRVMVASVSVPSPMSDNSFATEEGGGIDGAGELKLLIQVDHIPSPPALQSPPVTTPEYARSYEQVPEESEMFRESKRHRHQVIQLTSSQQAMSKSPRHSQNAGSDRGSPDSQAPRPPSPSVPSPETQESGFHSRLLRKDSTGQDGGSRLSSSPQKYEGDIGRLYDRLIHEGADPGAALILRDIIFADKVTVNALMAPVTPKMIGRSNRATRMWHLLLEVKEAVPGKKIYCCLLCPLETRCEYSENHDALRHLNKEHFDFSFRCEYCNHKFFKDSEKKRHTNECKYRPTVRA